MLWSPEELHRDHPDARRVHRHHEHRDALVLGHVGIGAGGQPDVVGVARQAGEDLRAVDHVLVAVAHGPGRQRGQVGARRWARCSRCRSGSPRPGSWGGRTPSAPGCRSS